MDLSPKCLVDSGIVEVKVGEGGVLAAEEHPDPNTLGLKRRIPWGEEPLVEPIVDEMTNPIEGTSRKIKWIGFGSQSELT
jgi:hypothetical protein